MAYNLNRFFVGSSILLVLFASYFLALDFFLFFVVTIFIFYELYKATLKSKKLLIFIFLLFLFEFSVNYFLIVNYIIIAITLFFLLSSIYLNRYFNIFFTLYVINILVLVSNLFLIDRNIIYIIISISFINDTIAYIVGTYVKGPLISPKMSPKKTWSGTSFSFFVTTLLFIYLDYSLFITPIMAISLFYGDIYFSYIKRK